MTTFHFIIITHNNFHLLKKCIARVEAQSYTDYCITIYDSGSTDPSPLKQYEGRTGYRILYNNENVAFCVGNNLATKDIIYDSKYIIYINPDAFLVSKTFLARAYELLESDSGRNVGVLGGKQLRYDLENNKPTEILDSTGIFQTWYGHWYDRGQGETDAGQYDADGMGVSVPAICGAAMICRSEALIASQLSEGEYFNNAFYMYKDDIDLSIRIRKAGHEVRYTSDLVVDHCRGWHKRHEMPKYKRIYSARNELSINRHLGLIKCLYSLIKLFLAKLGV